MLAAAGRLLKRKSRTQALDLVYLLDYIAQDAEDVWLHAALRWILIYTS